MARDEGRAGGTGTGTGRETAKEIWSRSTDRRPCWRILDGIKGADTVRRQCAKFELIVRLLLS